MAKIKVHELAKELGTTSKEVIEFLQKRGVDVKTASNALEESVAGMVRKDMNGGGAEKAAPAKKPAKEPAGAPAEATAPAKKPAKEPAKAPAEATAPAKESAKASAEATAPAKEPAKAPAEATAPAKEPAQNPAPKAPAKKAPSAQNADASPKKKKTIIIVSNQQNSKIGGRAPQSQGGRSAGTNARPAAQGARPAGRGNYSTQSGYSNSGYGASAGQRSARDGGRPAMNGQRGRAADAPVRPIRPLTPPSPTPSVQIRPQPQPKARPAEKPVPKPQETAAEARLKEQAAAEVQHSAPENTAPAVPETGAAVESRVTEGTLRKPESGERVSAGESRGAESGRSMTRPSEGRDRNVRREGRPSEGRLSEGREGRSAEGRERDGRGRDAWPRDGRDRDFRPREGRPQEGRDRDGRMRDRAQTGDRTQGGRTGAPFQTRGGTGNGRPAYNRTEGGAARPFRAGAEGGQGDRRTGSVNQGAGRGAAGYGRDGRGNAGPGNRFRGKEAPNSFAQETPSKDMEKKREQDKRRISQEKDKRSRKEFIYEEEEKLKKPGRFIRPEKKEEAAEEAIKVITLPETITIKELAEKMRLQPAAIIKKLFLQGRIVTVNQEISYEDAESIAMEYEILCEKEVKVDVIEELLKEDEENAEDMVERPPVVCVMGHVDHGKTSLLDAIRKTNVTDKEAGGITQHIGAYTVNISGRRITFLDTPGHEAFTAMRMRGANATDIAILVVAADDGVMPQTIEAINHAKAAGVEIVVAINKIDKPAANVERVKQELTEYGLISEDWGGSTVFAPVSAKTGEGIEQMLEMILLTADILELKANPKRRARGLVIEAELDKGRGPVATVLVQKGTLHVGDFISAGASHGKVRAMIDDKGKRVKEATPSMPVEILGLNDVPEAGEVFLAHDSDKTAKSYAETYLAQHKEKMIEETRSRMSLDDLFSQIQEGNLKELNLIVKADVQGSVEAVKQSLTKLSNDEVVVKCIHGGVGAINESDVMLAGASNAIIIGFNVRPDVTAKSTAEREGVDIRLYKVIYQAIEDIEAAMKGMLDPVFEEKVIGHAEVRQLFRASAVGNIAGSYVLDGVFQRNCKIRITREGKQIYEGELASLKRFKDDVKEVRAGYECGLVFAGFDQMQELDIVEAYVMTEVPR